MDLGKKCLKGKDLWEEKGNLSRGEHALRGNGGTGSQTGKGEKGNGGKDLKRERS